MQNKKTNATGRALIKKYESLELTAYLCPAKKWTIGYGNTFYEDGTPVKKGDTITPERAEKLFSNILSDFEKKANAAITSDVTDNQFAAFVSVLWNNGPGAKGKKSGVVVLKNGNPSTLLRRINANPNDPKIGAAFLSWCSPGSSFENGLRKRRAAEYKLYIS